MRKGLGARLNDARVTAGVRVEELAAATRYPAPYIALAERGRVRMLPKYYRVLMKTLGSLSAGRLAHSGECCALARVFPPSVAQREGITAL